MDSASGRRYTQKLLAPDHMERQQRCSAALQGSGKTLAFAIPIIQALLHERARLLRDGAADGGVEAAFNFGDPQNAASMAALTTSDSGPLRALVLCPTRELALQVRLPKLQLHRSNCSTSEVIASWACSLRYHPHNPACILNWGSTLCWLSTAHTHGPDRRVCVSRDIIRPGVQVCQHIQAIAKPCGVWAAAVVGGLSPLKQARTARHVSSACKCIQSGP